MASPVAVLLGEVKREGMMHCLEHNGEIVFERPLGIARPDGKAEAVLVVLEPGQNPREVAEVILWALR
jgi:hypothetical protein